MKILKENVSEKDKAEFLEEIKLMKCLSDKNIVRFLGVVTGQSKHLKILLEYVNQGSLQRLLAKGKVHQRGKLRVSIESAQGVLYLHKRGVIHRDLAVR